MGITLMSAVCALVAAVFLLFDGKSRNLAIASLLISGMQIAMVQGLARLHIVGLPIGKVLPAIVLLLGLVLLYRVQSKSQVAASVVLAMAGAIQLALVLRLI